MSAPSAVLYQQSTSKNSSKIMGIIYLFSANQSWKWSKMVRTLFLHYFILPYCLAIQTNSVIKERKPSLFPVSIQTPVQVSVPTMKEDKRNFINFWLLLLNFNYLVSKRRMFIKRALKRNAVKRKSTMVDAEGKLSFQSIILLL